MAHVQKRGDRYVVRHRGPDGTERSKTFTTARDARAYRAEVEAAKVTGGYIDPRNGRVLFGPYAQRWLDSRVGIRETTAHRDASYLRSLIVPTFGAYPLDQITPDDVRTWIADLDRRGRAAATISKALTIVRRILERAVTDHRIPQNPAAVADLDVPRQRRKTMTILSPAEIVELVNAAGPFFSTHLYTAAATGLRWGELAGLETSNIDLLRGEIRVESQLRELSGKLTLGAPPKTDSSIRTVTIPRSVSERIGEHLGRFPNNAGVVFTTIEGKLLRRSNFSKTVLKPAAAAIGRPGLTFHDLRHTHASVLLADGEPITNVSARLGHRDASITLRVYAHVLEGAERSASDRFEALLAGYPRDAHLTEPGNGTVESLTGQ